MAKKLIKVGNRCQILTSRGYCIGPISYPFYEEIQYLLPMISKGAEVIEILKDGREIKLTTQNFDKDNMATEDKKEERSSDLVSTPVLTQQKPLVQDSEKPQQPKPNQPQNNTNKNFNNNKKFDNKNKNKNGNQQSQKQNQSHVKPDVIIKDNQAIHNNQTKQKIVEDMIEEA